MMPNPRYANCCVFNSIFRKSLALSKLSTSVPARCRRSRSHQGFLPVGKSLDFAGFPRASHRPATAVPGLLYPGSDTLKSSRPQEGTTLVKS